MNEKLEKKKELCNISFYFQNLFISIVPCCGLEVITRVSSL